MGVGGWVLVVTFWGALLGLAVWALSRIFPRDEPTAREVPDRRLASGDPRPRD